MLYSSLPAFLLAILSLKAVVAAPGSDWPHWRPNGNQYQCSPAVVALAAGIQLNIIAQHGELNQTEALIAVESAQVLNMTAFYEGKGTLVADIAGGINIRKFNQYLIPVGNAAVDGLNTYAAAQATEMGLAQSLTGVPSHDLPILETIKSDVMGGIVLNEQNEANATKGCNLGVNFPIAY